MNISDDASKKTPSQWTEILLHFNPRCADKKRNGLVLNNRESGGWNNPELYRPYQLPNLFDINHLEIIIQIRPEGFVIFMDNICQALFSHKRDISRLRFIPLQR